MGSRSAWSAADEAVTSFAMVGDREKSLAAGCNGYIEKPINPSVLTAQMHKAVEKLAKARFRHLNTLLRLLKEIA